MVMRRTGTRCCSFHRLRMRVPLFTGSSFKGQYEGVLIYEYDRMPLVASTIQVTHPSSWGAQAAAVCWGRWRSLKTRKRIWDTT